MDRTGFGSEAGAWEKESGASDMKAHYACRRPEFSPKSAQQSDAAKKPLADVAEELADGFVLFHWIKDLLTESQQAKPMVNSHGKRHAPLPPIPENTNEKMPEPDFSKKYDMLAGGGLRAFSLPRGKFEVSIVVLSRGEIAILSNWKVVPGRQAKRILTPKVVFNTADRAVLQGVFADMKGNSSGAERAFALEALNLLSSDR